MPMDLDAVVLSNDRLSEDYNIVRLAAPAIASRCEPGQFVMVKRGLDSEPLLRRPFSIFEVLRDDAGRVSGLSLLNKRIGAVTRMLFDLEPGARLRCLGPLGRPFSVCTASTEAWMIAGGVGLAPFVTLGKALRDQGVRTTLFYGGRRAGDLYAVELFEQMGVRVVLATEDGSRGATGLVTQPLERALAATGRGTDVMLYACGPTPMMRAVADLGTTYDRPTEVSLEPVMGCGLGGCYSCVVRLRPSAPGAAGHLVRSCVEGPVFDADRVEWVSLGH